METSCNRDSLGSVGLDLQEFNRGGEQSLTWTCRSSTEVANLDLHEFYLKISTKVLSA